MVFPIAAAVVGAAAFLAVRNRRANVNAWTRPGLENPNNPVNGGNPTYPYENLGTRPTNQGATGYMPVGVRTPVSNLGVQPQTPTVVNSPSASPNNGFWSPAINMVEGTKQSVQGGSSSDQADRSAHRDSAPTSTSFADFVQSVGIAASVVNPGVMAMANAFSAMVNGHSLMANLYNGAISVVSPTQGPVVGLSLEGETDDTDDGELMTAEILASLEAESAPVASPRDGVQTAELDVDGGGDDGGGESEGGGGWDGGGGGEA